MQPTTQEARPPYVSFTIRAVEDRDASIESGRAMVKDEHFALITPHGSKDRIERKVSEWFGVLEEAVAGERMPASWVQAYRQAYEAWKIGKEIPVSGTSVRNWPLLTPAQIENLTNLKVLTVEDLAAANEELIQRLGMGGRALKDKASAWLGASGSDNSKVAEEVAKLKAENRQLSDDNKQMGEAIKQMRKDLRELKAAGQPEPA